MMSTDDAINLVVDECVSAQRVILHESCQPELPGK